MTLSTFKSAGNASSERRKPELLAPAGSMDAFKVALQCGADAVYLGLDRFNARRNAENLTLDGFAQACRMAHLADRRVYLTANIEVLALEFDDALDLVRQAWEAGADAVIVQDLGVLTALHERYPGIELHASTQMNIGTRAGVELMRDLGVKRVTLARELTLQQIADLAKVGVELEVFAHGALCICASGQCLMSSLIGRRSANRGLCAQPCRLAWELVDQQGNPEDTAGAQGGSHLLSPKDLCTLDLLPQLIDAGVVSLKLEGRMKAPGYVAACVGAYRQALDRAFAEPDTYAPTEDERAQLAEAFSRGFTTAYLTGQRGNDMMGYQRPNNRGVQVGRVSGIADGLVELSCDKPLRKGDVLEYWTVRGRYAQEIDELLVDGRTCFSCEAGESPRLVVRKPVAPGDRVFRVRSAQQEERVAQLLEAPGVPAPLTFTVDARLGQPLAIQVTDAAGRSGRAQGRVCEPARTVQLTDEQVREHVGRLGGTPYSAAVWDITLDDGVGMGFSQLHNVRKQALENYEGALLGAWKRGHAPAPVGGESACAQQAHRPQARRSRMVDQPATASELAVLAASPEQVALAARVGLPVYLPALEVLEHRQRYGDVSGVRVVMPTVVRDNQSAALLELAGQAAGAVADNPGLLRQLVAAGVKVEAGIRNNVVNPQALDTLVRLGASRVWLGPELSLIQIRDLAPSSAVPLSITVFGAQELMVTEHCELMALGPCEQQCGTCPRRRERHLLRDAKGYLFPVATDLQGRGHIYNSVELDITPDIPQLAAVGVQRFIIDGTLLANERLSQVISRATQALSLEVGAPRPFERLEGTTTGHLFRGVL